jgi:HSP20 family protein
MVWINPFDEIRRLQSEFNRFFEDFWRKQDFSVPVTQSQFISGFREPLADIKETNSEYIVTMELPGINKSDIELNVTDSDLEVKVERKEAIEERGSDFIRSERSYRGFYRNLRFPSKVIPDEATARYKDGVLEIRIPKAEVSKKTKKIEIK